MTDINDMYPPHGYPVGEENLLETPAVRVRKGLIGEFRIELSRFETAHEAEVLAALHKQTHYTNYSRAKSVREAMEATLIKFLSDTFDEMIKSSDKVPKT